MQEAQNLQQRCRPLLFHERGADAQARDILAPAWLSLTVPIYANGTSLELTTATLLEQGNATSNPSAMSLRTALQLALRRSSASGGFAGQEVHTADLSLPKRSVCWLQQGFAAWNPLRSLSTETRPSVENGAKTEALATATAQTGPGVVVPPAANPVLDSSKGIASKPGSGKGKMRSALQVERSAHM